MNMWAAGWRVSTDASDEEVASVLSCDPVWNCFALADLEPPLRGSSQFVLASRGASCALCLILRHPVIGEVVSPWGEQEGIEAILQEVMLPARPLLQMQEAHVALLARFYRPETANWGRLLRMALTAASWYPHLDEPPHPVQQLTAADLPALQAFYASSAAGRFAGALFAQNLFFGAYEGASLVAAGGTHVLAQRFPLAVLGWILVAPSARRQGYGTALTSALVAHLFAQGFPLVVLNVLEDNDDAIGIYQRLGFQTQHHVVTGRSVQRSARSPRAIR